MADKSALYVEKSKAIVDNLNEIASEKYPGLGLQVMISPFGEGARAHLMRAQGKGIYPVSNACTLDLGRSIKDIVHGLWECLATRGSDEIRHAGRETRTIRLAKSK